MLTIVLMIIAGLFIGSLLNLLIIRIPREQSLLGCPRCTRTGAPLQWWQLLPLVGWFVQRGRAANGKPLHWIFPLIEILSTLALVRLYQLYGFSNAFFFLAFVCLVLLLTGAIDWLHRYIYTFVILGSTLVVIIWAAFLGLWVNSLIGALVGGAAFLLLYLLAKVLFPGVAAPFGLGDVYLALFIGAAVGPGHLAGSLFYGMLMAGIAALIVIIMRARKLPAPTYLPYGSYLCLGVVLYICLRGL